MSETDSQTDSQADAAQTAGNTRIQIARHITKDRLFDICDMLNLEARHSKIALTLVELGDSMQAVTRVRHYLDAADAKLLCHDIINGFFSEWTDHKGSLQEDRTLQARVFTIRKDPKYRQPIVIKIDNGVGEQLPGGAVKLAQTTGSLTILLSEWEARKLAMTVLDYIRDWEIVNFRRRQAAQTHIIERRESNA